MRLNYVLPDPRFRRMITIHAAVEAAGIAAVHTLPAMLPNLHIRLAGTCSYVFADGRAEPAPAVSLIGPTNAAYRMVFSSDLRLAAAGFLPTGWATLVGIPALECADRLIDAACIWGDPAVDRLLSRLHATSLDGRQTGTVESFLEERRSEPASRRLRQVAAIDGWLERSQLLAVDELTQQLDICRRHVQRAALDLYGAGPKTLSMKYRALRAAAKLALVDETHVLDASMLFADQSHMIRDFHRFVGRTPHALERDPRLAARTTIAGRWGAGARRPLVILS